VSTKQRILRLIVRYARRLGRAPLHSEFSSLAGMSMSSVSRNFPSWNDAVKAAGLRPFKVNLSVKDSELLTDWGETVRKSRRLPSRLGYLREGRHDPRTLEKRFGPWPSVPRAFREFAKGKPEWADVLRVLNVAKPYEKARTTGGIKEGPALWPRRKNARPKSLRGRPTYGNLMDFRWMRHEPTNEQGVVLLFGMLAKELGYTIETTQTGFPDCEAKREIAPGRWQRVHIEFEYESRNFLEHGHSPQGCDVIVCWRHNWGECPPQIEVVELSKIVRCAASSDE
jgi:hypothetical protein